VNIADLKSSQYYINPVSYAWQSCMENEFMRISLTCDGNSVVPRNGFGLSKFSYVTLLPRQEPNVTSLAYRDTLSVNQACTLFGAESGNAVISGRNYIRVGYGLDPADMWRRNFVVLIAFFLAFQLAQVLALEYYPVCRRCVIALGSVYLSMRSTAIWFQRLHLRLCSRGRGDAPFE
jgi:ATP-binding cassette, subfamily G (WHITE), member 2, SNQ2